MKEITTKIKMQFDPQIAKDIGVEEAIMYSNLDFWCAYNKAHKQNMYDGNYWTYNSTRAFKELFKFWTTKQIERILKNLEKGEYIKTGNYNNVKYDRTKWYTCIYSFDKMDSTINTNGSAQMVEPIPDNKPNNKTKCKFEQSSNNNNDKNSIVKTNQEDNDKKPDINSLLDVFYQEFGDGKIFKHRGHRNSAEFLINKYGLVKSIQYAKAALAVKTMQFAPVITTPTELRDKLPKLTIFFQKEKNRPGRIFMGTDFSKKGREESETGKIVMGTDFTKKNK